MQSINITVIIRIIVIVFGLLLSVVLGSLIGENKWPIIISIFALVLGLAVAHLTLRHMAAACFCLATLDMWMAPAGFKLSAMEQTGIIAAVCWLLICWRKNYNSSMYNELVCLNNYKIFSMLVFIAVTYSIFHYFFNMLIPYEPLAFGWKGAAKAYAQVYGPFLMIVALIKSKVIRRITANNSLSLLKIFLVASSVVVCIGVYRSFIAGFGSESALTFRETIEASRLFIIPGINMYDNIYTLRCLGPAASLIGAVFLINRPLNVPRWLPLSISFIGLIGSALSGGRASILFSFCLIFAVLIISRKTPFAIAACAFGVLSMAVIMMIPIEYMKEAPWHIQRSIAFLRPDLETKATMGIEGSTDMRIDYFTYAWERYINGSFRLVMIGRSVGEMDDADIMSFELYDELARKEFSVRRLATHNLLTDMLLGWGLIGYLLNMFVWFSCVSMLLSYRRKFSRNSHGSGWLLIAAIFMTFWIVYSHLGGSFIWPLAVWLIIIALSQSDGLIGATHNNHAS